MARTGVIALVLLLAALRGFEGLRKANPLISLGRTPLGLHYKDVAVAACAEVIFGGGCCGKDSFSRSSSSCNSGSGCV